MDIQTYKYPRTPHLPWSLGVQDDDIQKKTAEMKGWQGQLVVVTEKMDGENTNLYSNGFLHARSLDSRDHVSRHWVKQWWSERAHELPSGWRVCGENLYARHTIAYDELPHYFMGFSVWDENNRCLDWDQTLHWFEKLGIEPVNVLYEGVFDEKHLRQLAKTLDTKRVEGYVMRSRGAFEGSEFAQHMAKMVRKGHVQTDQHWMHQAVVPNQLRDQKMDFKMK